MHRTRISGSPNIALPPTFQNKVVFQVLFHFIKDGRNMALSKRYRRGRNLQQKCPH